MPAWVRTQYSRRPRRRLPLGRTAGQTISASAAVATWTAQAATVETAVTVTATAAVASWIAAAASVVAEVTVVATAAVATWFGAAATLDGGTPTAFRYLARRFVWRGRRGR